MGYTGDLIKHMREAHGWSQEELGRRIGVKRAAVQKYEKGTVSNIPISTVERLALIFETTPAHLLGWDDRDSASYEVKLLSEVAHFYGDSVVELIDRFQMLSTDGKAKVIQYAADIHLTYCSQ